MNTAGHCVEGTTRSTAAPGSVWEVWTDPSVWCGGPIARAELHGAFEVGSTLTTKVHGYPAMTSTITLIEFPGLWVGVAKAPGLTMTYEHIIEPVDGGTRLIERATFGGPLGSLAARLLRRRLRTTFADTTAHCARLAEARALT